MEKEFNVRLIEFFHGTSHDYRDFVLELRHERLPIAKLSFKIGSAIKPTVYPAKQFEGRELGRCLLIEHLTSLEALPSPVPDETKMFIEKYGRTPMEELALQLGHLNRRLRLPVKWGRVRKEGRKFAARMMQRYSPAERAKHGPDWLKPKLPVPKELDEIKVVERYEKPKVERLRELEKMPEEGAKKWIKARRRAYIPKRV